MALVVLPAIALGGFLAAEVLRDDETSSKSKHRREMKHKATPLNTSSVTINTDSHLGVELRNTINGFGVMISQLDPNDAVAEAGVRVGDWIITINGQYVENHTECIRLVNASIHQRSPIQVTYMTRATMNIDLSGLHLKGAQRKHLGVSFTTEPGKKGAAIAELYTEDLLAQYGLQVGDVITHVGGVRVINHEEALQELTKRAPFKPRQAPRVVEIVYMTSGAHLGSKVEGKADMPVAAGAKLCSEEEFKEVECPAYAYMMMRP